MYGKKRLLLALALRRRRKFYSQRIWMHPINQQREIEGEFHTLIPQLRQDESRFQGYFRMSPAVFDELLTMVKNSITKMNTNYRNAISPDERLALTLR